MTNPLDTAELLAFAKIVEAKSVSRAAFELGVPRATVSRRLARLEARLKVRLLRRTSRSLVLTSAGEELYRHTQVVFDALEQAEARVRRRDDSVRGELRVSALPLLTDGFPEMLIAFARRYPDVRLQVHLSMQTVDLARGEYDVAIRGARELQPGLVARTLSREPLVGVASPAYLAEMGTPRSLQELAQHRCLLGFVRGEVPQTHWTTAKGKVRVNGTFFSNDTTLLCAAAVEGHGIALLPTLVVRASLKTGALVRVLPTVLHAKSQLAVVYLERQFLPPQVRAFVESAVAWAKQRLDD